MLLSRWKFSNVLLAAVTVVCCEVSGVAAQSSFFEGKSIRLIVGYPAGTTHDIWARTVAPYCPILGGLKPSPLGDSFSTFSWQYDNVWG